MGNRSQHDNGPTGWFGADWKAGLRESIAALIALVVLALSTWMLGTTYVAVGKVNEEIAASPETMQLYDRAYTRQKDVMLYVLSLFGTVLGYYFGRVPAERRAERAEMVADGAQKNASEAVQVAKKAQEDAENEAERAEATDQKIVDAKETLRRLQGRISPATSEGKRVALGVDSGTDIDSNQVHGEIEALLQRLG